MRPFFYFIIASLFFNILNSQKIQPKEIVNKDSLNTVIEEKNKFKFFGLTQFTFNQAYFENWVSGGGKFYVRPF